MADNFEYSIPSPSDSPTHSSPESDLDQNALAVRPAASEAEGSEDSMSIVATPNQDDSISYLDQSLGQGAQHEHEVDTPNSPAIEANPVATEAPDEDEQTDIPRRATPEFKAINIYSSDEDRDESEDEVEYEDEDQQPEPAGKDGENDEMDVDEVAEEEQPEPFGLVEKGKEKAVDNGDIRDDEGHAIGDKLAEDESPEPIDPDADEDGPASPDQENKDQAGPANNLVAEEQPTRGIERPVTRPGHPRTFNIVRLIENTDKKGNNQVSAIRLRAPWFMVDFGDFLLDLSTARAEIAQVRNYWGQERFIPRRMLQNIYQPWDIPSKIRITHNGIPLPLGFLTEPITADEAGSTVTFEEEEAVMVMSNDFGGPDQVVRVTDYERHAGELDVASIDRGIERPWGILVNEDDLTASWTKKSAPKLPKGGKRKRKDDSGGDEDEDEDDNADSGSSKKPPRKKATKKPRETKAVDNGNGGEGPSGTNAGTKYAAGYLSAAVDELMGEGKKAAAAKDLQPDKTLIRKARLANHSATGANRQRIWKAHQVTKGKTQVILQPTKVAEAYKHALSHTGRVTRRRATLLEAQKL